MRSERPLAVQNKAAPQKYTAQRNAARRKKRKARARRFYTVCAFLVFAAFAVLPRAGGGAQTQQNPYINVNAPEGGGHFMGADGELLNALTKAAQSTPALAPVLDAPQDYPRSLMQLFLVNGEVLNTLLFYPAWDGTFGAAEQGDIASGYPRFMQWDTRWAFQNYGDDMLAVTGCGPTCLSSVLVHLTRDINFSPSYVAQYSQENGYYAAGTGTAWALMLGGAAGLGLQSEELPLGEGRVLSALRAGKPVICSVREGDFTTGAGHFIVLVAVDDAGNITVHDPARNANNQRTWRYEEIEHQIKNLWAFSVA